MREEAAPEVVNGDRNHRCRVAREHPLDAAFVFAQLPVAGQLAFGEDADEVALANGVVHVFKGGEEQIAVFALSGDGECACAFEDVAQYRDLENLVIHDEAHRAADGDHENQRVHVAQVVAGDIGRAGFRHIVAPLNTQAVAAGDDENNQAAHDKFGNDGEDVERDGKVQAEQQRKQRLHTPAEHAQHQHAEQADDDEEERVDDVVRRDDLRFVAAFGTVLDDGVERHGVDAAAKGDGEEGEGGGDEARVVAEGGQRLQLTDGGIALNEDDARKPGGEDKGADRHQPRLNPPAREQVA